jgi:tRNA threonylcarbamoyl adenosine modification protein (Sua5/YciO/YrdC/YwlC family)
VTRVFDATAASTRATGVTAAVSTAGRGRLVLLPTESVYALLADAFSAGGVRGLRTLRGRPPGAPLPVAVCSLAMLRGIAERLPSAGQRLVEAFWPGHLSLVCHPQPSLAWDVASSASGLTVRMPIHPLALEVVRGVGPSVLLGTGAATASQRDGVDVVLDAGELPGPVDVSSVVDVRGPVPVLVRAGAVPLERLAAVAPDLEDATGEAGS